MVAGGLDRRCGGGVETAAGAGAAAAGGAAEWGTATGAGSEGGRVITTASPAARTAPTRTTATCSGFIDTLLALYFSDAKLIL